MKSKIVTAWKADMDGFYSNVVEVQIDKSLVDNDHTYFKSFNAAKKCVLNNLKTMITEYKANYVRVKATQIVR